MSDIKLTEAFDVIHNSIDVLERLVEFAKHHENNYTFIKRREQATCHELILEAAGEFYTLAKAFEQLIASSTAKISELYVRFCETEDTLVVDTSGIGEDIKKLSKCAKISAIVEKIKLTYTSDTKKLFTLNKTITNMKEKFLFQRIRSGQNISRKKQSLKQDHLLSSALVIDKTMKQAKDWTAYYNPDVEPAIDILHHIDCKINTSEFNGLTYSSDGQLMVVATGDVAVVYNAETEAKECELKDTTVKNKVRSVCFGSNGCLIVGQSNSIGVWDILHQKHQYTLNGHNSSVYALAYLPSKNYLFSGSDDHTVKVWNMEQQCCVHTLGDNIIDYSVVSIAVSSNEHLLSAGSYDNFVTIWDTNTGAFLSKYTGHTGCVYSVAFSKDSKLFTSGSLDSSVKLWDITSGKCIHTFIHHENFVNSVAFTSSNWLVSGSTDKKVIFYDLRSFLVPCALLQDSNPVRRLAISPAGKTFVTLNYNNYIRVWKSW